MCRQNVKMVFNKSKFTTYSGSGTDQKDVPECQNTGSIGYDSWIWHVLCNAYDARCSEEADDRGRLHTNRAWCHGLWHDDSDRCWQMREWIHSRSLQHQENRSNRSFGRSHCECDSWFFQFVLDISCIVVYKRLLPVHGLCTVYSITFPVVFEEAAGNLVWHFRVGALRW